MSHQPAVLVYDGRKRPFRTIARAFTYRMDDIVVVPWESEPIQAFLEIQFGGRPFVFLLIEDDVVHAGKRAVERSIVARGLGKQVAGAFERLYPTIAEPLGKVIHGEVPADIHGTYTLEPATRKYLDPLRSGTANSTRER